MNDTDFTLDALMSALANEHRREIVRFLGLQPASISHLAEMRGLSLPAIHKHIKVLEEAGLVHRRKMGRSNFLSLRRRSLGTVWDWVGQFHPYWGSDDESLENYAHYLGAEPPLKEGP